MSIGVNYLEAWDVLLKVQRDPQSADIEVSSAFILKNQRCAEDIALELNRLIQIRNRECGMVHAANR
jgi:hypothetical protein